MKAVFLDRATFSSDVDLPMPQGISDYMVYDSTPYETDVIVERCQGVEIVITNKVPMTAQVLARLPTLKLIALTATGKNNVDLKACDDLGITVQNVEGYSTDSVPEHTFMLMLGAMRAGLYYHNQATNGNWQTDGRFCLVDVPILDLAGKTLGIIGAGNIGQKVAHIAQAFGMNVLFAERQGKTPRDERYTAFDDVLAKAHVISLHCPLTDDTHHLINDDTLGKTQNKPLIINVARGAVVDSGAICRALENDKILGYASDVFCQEPFDNDEPLLALKDHPRVFFTPHNAWGSMNAQSRLWQILCHQVAQFIKR